MQFPVPSETFASLDIETLRQQGQEISVFCMRPKHPLFNKLLIERGHSGLSVLHFSMCSVFSSAVFFLRHPLMVLSLIRWFSSSCKSNPRHLAKSFLMLPSALSIFSRLYKEKPDVVHLFWGHYPSMVGFLVKKYMPKTVLSMFLGAHDLVTAYPGSARLSKIADLLFTHSKSNLPMIAEMGMDATKFNVVVRGTKLSGGQGLCFDKFEGLNNIKILTACRLVNGKGVDDILNIFKDVLGNFPDATLIVAGDGPARQDLIKLSKRLNVERGVRFLGHVPQETLLEYMRESQFFILMSKCSGERLPNVVKEAMHQCCIAISTNTPGIDELIDDGVNGYVVGFGSIQSAAAAVNNSINNAELALSMAKKARKKIKYDFNVEVSMSRYLQLWEQACTNLRKQQG